MEHDKKPTKPFDLSQIAARDTTLGRVVGGTLAFEEALGIGRNSLLGQYRESAVARLARVGEESSRNILKNVGAYDRGLDKLRHGALSGADFALRGLLPEIPSTIEKAMRLAEQQAGIGQLRDPGGAIAKAMNAYERLHDDHARIGRAARWAGELSSVSSTDIASLINGRQPGLTREIHRLVRKVGDIDALTGVGLAAAAQARGSVGSLASGAEAASLKMSVFASALDVLRPGAPTGVAAFNSLFGEWHTRPDLPPRFWRDNEYRRDMYREAEVDPWLVDGENAEVVEVLVESGVVGGRQTRRGVAAVVEVGPMRVEITAPRARSKAFALIDAFEVWLRAFVAAKLEAAAKASGGDPAKWFVQRVPGDIVKRAKEMRRDARQAGEAHAPLIQFTNLGDMIQIVSRNDNWELFAPVFIDRDAFKVDLQRLTATRRPTMHARAVDPTRLLETVLVIRRMQTMMEVDGSWIDGWDDDA